MEWKKRERTYSGTTDEAPSERERVNRQVARRAAAEGMVLLRNEGVLPLLEGAKAALYGGGAVHMIKGGTGSGDVNENAVQFIVDWVLANKAFFNPQTIGTCYGMMSSEGEVAYIFPSILNQALTKAGFSPQKTLRYMGEQGLIEQTPQKKANGSVVMRNAVRRRFGGRLTSFICFNIGRISETTDEIEALADEYDRLDEDSQSQTSMGQWTEVAEDGDLPF